MLYRTYTVFVQWNNFSKLLTWFRYDANPLDKREIEVYALTKESPFQDARLMSDVITPASGCCIVCPRHDAYGLSGNRRNDSIPWRNDQACCRVGRVPYMLHFPQEERVRGVHLTG